MIKSISYWAFPGGHGGNAEVFEILRLAKAAGFEAVEMCISDSGKFHLGTTEDECYAIRAEADKLNLKLATVNSGLYWKRNLADADPMKRKEAMDDLKAMIQICSWLGANVLSVIPGCVDLFDKPERPVQSYDFVWEHATSGIRALLPYSQIKGVHLGIANVWNKFLLSPLEMRNFIDQFDTPWIGAYVDVANMLPYGYPEQWLRILNERVLGVVFKDYRRSVGTLEGFVGLLEGDVNWPEVTKALGEIHYSGTVTAGLIPEYHHYPLNQVQKTSLAMNTILNRPIV